MPAAALLGALALQGVALENRADCLNIRAPRPLKLRVLDAIRCHKSELLELLQLESASLFPQMQETSTRCEVRECLPRDLYDAARAFAYANRLHRLGRIDADQRAALRRYALATL